MKERLLVVLAALALGLVVAFSPSSGSIAHAEGTVTPPPQFSNCQGGGQCGG